MIDRRARLCLDMKTIASITLILVPLFGAKIAFSEGGHPPPYQGSAEFERIKSLAGKWEGKMDMGQGPTDMTVVYRVVAGGSAVEERTFPDTPMEMVTMYHDKDGKLALTHFCMLQNQPAMVFKSSDEKTVRMKFDKRSGIDVKKGKHMHDMSISFNDDGTITQNWRLFDGGKAQESHPIILTRVDS